MNTDHPSQHARTKQKQGTTVSLSEIQLQEISDCRSYSGFPALENKRILGFPKTSVIAIGMCSLFSLVGCDMSMQAVLMCFRASF